MARDAAFDDFMNSASGFGSLSWREALGAYEHAESRATAALEAPLATLFQRPRFGGVEAFGAAKTAAHVRLRSSRKRTTVS